MNLAIRYHLESNSLDRISGWVGHDENDAPCVLRLEINGRELGLFTADRYRKDLEAVATDGRAYFDIRLNLKSDPEYREALPHHGHIRLVNVADGNVLSELVTEGAAEGDFANEFGESYKYYYKGGGFYIPLEARTEEWWASTRHAIREMFARADRNRIELQLGYGALLGHVREGRFVPHDDDVDLVLIAGEQPNPISASVEFARQLNVLAEGLPLNFDTNGQAHVHFDCSREVSLDFFAAWIKDGRYFQNFTIAGEVSGASVLPSSSASFQGEDVRIPRSPDSVLAAIYGPSWRTPNPEFTWSRPPQTSALFRPIHNYDRQANKAYWNDRYRSGAAAAAGPKPPSQFAAFVTDFLEPSDRIVEFGSGDGRDTFFFARYGWEAVGCDYSEIAVARCRSLCRDLPTLKFEVCNVEETHSVKEFLARATGDRSGRLVFYSRFFLHAVAESGEEIMRTLIDEASQPDDLVALEFRVTEDQARPKETPPHFRRYVNADSTLAAWKSLGWEPIYKRTGDGVAKYRDDDAVVCRIVVKKLASAAAVDVG
jgi:SAM-dependent methyltransferase